LVPSILCNSCFTTLYSNDPLFAGISLKDGSGSFQYSNNFVQSTSTSPELVVLNNATTNTPYFQINPNWFSGTNKTGGFASYTEAQLAQEFGIGTPVNTTVNSSPLYSVYMSITYSNGRFSLAKSFSNTSEGLQTTNLTLSNNNQVIPTLVANTIYLINSTNLAQTSDSRIVKLKVEEVLPTSVTFRWDVLWDGSGNPPCSINNNQGAQSYDVIATYQGVLPQLLNAPIWLIVAIVVLFAGFAISLILVIVLFVRVKRAGYEQMP